MKTFTLTHNGTSEELPIEIVENLLDKVLSAAWRASKYKMQSSVEFHGDEIPINPDRFTYPICDDATKILAHLHHFGLMLDYNPEIKAKKSVAWNEMERYQIKKAEEDAKEKGIPTFRRIYIMKMNHGGPRKGGGRPKIGGKVIGVNVNDEVYESMKRLAINKAVSLSSYASEILTDWVKQNATPTCK